MKTLIFLSRAVIVGAAYCAAQSALALPETRPAANNIGALFLGAGSLPVTAPALPPVSFVASQGRVENYYAPPSEWADFHERRDDDSSYRAPLTMLPPDAAEAEVAETPPTHPGATIGITTGGSFTIGAKFTMTVSGLPADGVFEYRWQRGNNNGGFVDLRGRGADTKVYSIKRWGGWKMLRVMLKHTARDGAKTELISEPVELNSEPRGELRVFVVNNASPLAAGVTLSLDVGQISDANNRPGEGVFLYRWLGDLGELTGVEKPTYVMREKDVERFNIGRPMRVYVDYQDGMGFVKIWLLPVNAPRVRVWRDGEDVFGEMIDPVGETEPSTYAYRWHGGGTAGGVFGEISGATMTRFALPPHPPGRRFVRMSVSYYNKTEKKNDYVMSPPLRVAGISSGTLGIRANGGVTGEYSAEVDGLVNIYGRTPRPEELHYQWQAGAHLDGKLWIWKSLPATLRSYTPKAADIAALVRSYAGDNAYKYLRVVASDPAGAPRSTADLVSPSVWINTPTRGSLSFTIRAPSEGLSKYAPGAAFLPDKSGLSDDNGVDRLLYLWEAHTAQKTVVVGGGDRYKLNPNYFPRVRNAGEISLRLKAIHRDAFGYRSTVFSDFEQFEDFPATVTVRFFGGRHRGGVFDGFADAKDKNGEGTIEYVFYAGNPYFGGYRQLPNYDGQQVGGRYYIPFGKDWNSGDEWVYVTAIHRDPFGGETRVSSPPWMFNALPTAEVRFSVLNNESPPRVGMTVVLNVSKVSDANNLSGGAGGNVYYLWYRYPKHAGRLAVHGPHYQMTEGDIWAVNNDGPLPWVSPALRDDMRMVDRITTVMMNLVQARVWRDGGTVWSTLYSPGHDTLDQNYHWFQSDSPDGEYNEVVANAIRYRVPLDHNPTKPYVRMSLKYLQKETNLVDSTSNFVWSYPVRVAGIESGTLGIHAGGFASGAEYTADISRLTTILGRVARPGGLTYRWQRATTAVGNWENIAATNYAYALNPADFGGAYQWLRVVAVDPSNYQSSSVVLTAAAVLVESPSAGTLGITVSRSPRAGAHAPGAEFFADTRGLRDANGVGGFTYAWFLSRNGRTVRVGTGESYVVATTDLPPGKGVPTLRLEARHTDVFGFDGGTSSYAEAFYNLAPSGAPVVRGDGFVAGGKLTADISGIGDENGIIGFAYQWQGGNAAGYENLQIDDAQSGVFVIPATWPTVYASIRVVATQSDGFGDATLLTSGGLLLAHPSTGAPRVEVENNAAAAAGVVLSVNRSAIADENGIGEFSYHWRGTENDSTAATYTLTAADMLNINRDALPWAELSHRDGLGFVHRWSATLELVRASIRLDGATVVAKVSDVSGVSDGVYNYRWEQSGGGEVVEIPQARGRAYVVPAAYDATKPFLRLSLSYRRKGDGVLLPAYSLPLRVAGVVGGTVGIVGDGVTTAASVRADIGDLRDVLGRVPDVENLTYQWQTGTSATDGWRDVAAGRGLEYRLAAADFANGRVWLRVVVGDKAKLATDIVAPAMLISSPTEGTLEVSSFPGRYGGSLAQRAGVHAEDGTFTAETGGLRDANGFGGFGYAWFLSRNGETERVGTEKIYIFDHGELPAGAGMPTLRLEVRHTDTLGFVSKAFTYVEVFRNVPAIGTVILYHLDGVAPGDLLQPDLNDIYDANGPGGYSFQWQGGNASGYENLQVGEPQSGFYTLPENWSTVYVSIRLVAKHFDRFGDSTLLTSGGLLLKRPSTGAPRLEVANNAAAVVAAVVTVNRTTIADENGIGEFSYQWRGTENESAGATYTLTDADILNIDRNAPPSVELSHRDGLGFVHRWSATLGLVRVSIRLTRTKIDSAVSDVFDISDGVYGYRWEQSGGGEYTEIAQAHRVAMYAVPAAYDSAKPFLRLSLSYRRKSDGVLLPAYSAPVRVAGVSGGTVGIIADVTPATASYRADTGDLRDIFGRVPDVEDLTYQWQAGSSANGGWRDVGTAGGVYRLSLADFADGSGWLRVVVGDKAKLTADIASPAVLVESGLLGTVGVVGDGVMAAASVRADVGDLRDILGRAPAAEDLTYRWQTGTSATDGWRDVGAAGAQVYRLSVADFSKNRGWLRVVVSDKVEQAIGIASPAVFISSPTEGTVGVRVAPPQGGGAHAPGALYTADTSGLQDANGIGELSYKWFMSRDNSTILVGNNARYIVTRNAFPQGAGLPTLRLEVRHTDPFGFDGGTFSYAEVFRNVPLSGNVSLRADGFGVGDRITADVSGVRDNNGIGGFTYQWQGGNAAGYEDLNLHSSSSSVYVILPHWPTVYVSVRVRVRHEDGINNPTLLTSDGLLLARPQFGAPRLEMLHNAAPAAGRPIYVNHDAVGDANGVGVFSYQWRRTEGAAAGLSYNLKDGDILNINRNAPPWVVVSHRDQLGFMNRWSVTLELVRVSLRLEGATVVATVLDAFAASDGAYDYRWEQSGGGEYVEIPEARGRTYVPPPDYDLTKPLLRVSLSYRRTADGENLPAYSAPVRVAGLSGGTVGIVGDSVMAGASVRADVGDLRDILGRASDVEDLTYQWQTGTSANDGWRDAAAGDGREYRLAAADFGNGRAWLRVVVGDKAKLAADISSPAMFISSPTEGTLGVSSFPGRYGGSLAQRAGVHAEDGTFTAETGGLRDANGVGGFGYAWFLSRNGETERVGTEKIYIFDHGDMPAGGGMPTLRLEVRHTDALGFVGKAFTYVEVFRNVPAIGTVILYHFDGVAPGDLLQPDLNDIYDANGPGGYSFQWQGGNASGYENLQVGDAQSGFYTLPENWSTVYVSIRLVAKHFDRFGDSTLLTSAGLSLERPSTGAPRLEMANNAAAVAGAVVTVNRTAIADENGIGEFSYRWLGTRNNSAAATYTLTDADILNIDSNAPPQVEVSHRDGLRFVHHHSATLKLVRASILLRGTTVFSSVSDVFGISDGAYGYRWEQSGGGEVTEITQARGARMYVVPVEYDATNPFLRLSLSYRLRGGGGLLPVYSSSLRVAGVAGGTVGVVGDGLAVGAAYRADTDGLRDILGRVPGVEDLTYQWQTGTSANGGWRDANAGSGREYRLASADFANGRGWLRVVVGDKAKLAADISSPAVGIVLPTSLVAFQIVIKRAPSGELWLVSAARAQSSSYEALLRGAQDGETVAYQWAQDGGGGFADIPGAAGRAKKYQPQAGELSGGEPRLRVVAAVTSPLGLVIRHTAFLDFRQIPPSADGLSFDSSFVDGGKVDFVRAGKLDANGVAAISLTWQAAAAGGAYVAPQATTESHDGLADGRLRLMRATWNPAHVSLRLLAAITDNIGGAATLILPALLVDAPTKGAPFVYFPGERASFGATAIIRINELQDANDAPGADGVLSYRWLEPNGADKGNRGQTYTLTRTDAANIENGAPPLAELTYTDGLGFVRRWTVAVNLLGVGIGLGGEGVTSAISDPNKISDGTYVYQWEQSATPQGTYTPLSSDRAGLEVPTSYDVTKPYVRLRLFYRRRDGAAGTGAGGGAVDLPALSAPLRVAGVVSGKASVQVGGAAAGATYWADIGGLVNVLGRAPDEDDLIYQWQTGTATLATDGGWTDTPITAAAYTLATKNFNHARRYLRLIVRDKAGLAADMSLSALDVNRPTEGAVEIHAQESEYRPGGKFTANIAALRDGNGIGEFRYLWLGRLYGESTFVPLATVTAAHAATYTLRAEHFRGGRMPLLAVRVRHTDKFGFTHPREFAATLDIVSPQRSPRRTGGEVRITTSGYGDKDVFGGVMETSSGDAATGVSYEWQRGRRVGGMLSFARLPAASARTYTLRSTLSGATDGGWDTAHEYLRLKASHRDDFGLSVTLTSSPLLVARQTEGRLRVVGNASAGQILTADISALSDANDNAASAAKMSFLWLDGNGAPIAGQARATTRLREEDVLLSRQGKRMRLMLRYQDGMGFVSTLSAVVALQQNPLTGVEHIDRLSALFGMLESRVALDIVGTHLDTLGESPARTGDVVEVNDVQFNGRHDIAQALANRAPRSRQGGKEFALDSFAWRHYGVDADGKRWSAWSHGGWETAEGEPLIKGEAFKYRGESFGLFGGVDKDFGNVRAGLAAGRTETELDVNLSGDGQPLDDSVRRELQALLPYAEWGNDAGRLRVIGGYGVGEFEVRETGGDNCAATTDADWAFAALSGKYRLLSSPRWDASVVGDASYTRSASDAAACRNAPVTIPAADATSGELLVGGRLNYLFRAGGGTANPRVGFNARSLLGDIQDDLAFDFVGGMLFGAAEENLSFNIEGKTQLNNTTHRRDGLNARLQYDRGGVSSSLGTTLGMEDGARVELTQRWELGYAGAWGANELGANIHIERRGAADDSGGAEFRFRF